MTSRSTLWTCIVAACLSPACSRVHSADDDAARWWQHVSYLAADEREGRQTGSRGHRQAVEYAAKQFRELGMQPAGADGFYQPVEFVERRIDEKKSSLELLRGGTATPLKIRQDFLLRAAGTSGEVVEAPLVFVGYGLRAPEARYDDFAGLDLQGKVIVSLSGHPRGVPSLLSAYYSSAEVRSKQLQQMGVLGAISIMNPALREIPWSRMALMQADSSMTLADPAMADARLQVGASINPERADVWLQGSKQSFADLRQADGAHQPLPKFPLTASLRAKTVFSESRVVSDNVVAKLPGADPALAGEYVLLSAHIDHVGVGEPIGGDAIRNGAMDNASGVASLLEVARMLRESPRAPRRSVLLLACTAEEKGLLGSRYFAERPTVPMEKVVANINLDMFLPLGPLKMVRGYGLHETDLERTLQAAAAEAGLGVQDDPQPQRNVFIRSDQYSFIKKGVPALFLSFGFHPGKPDARVYEQWFGARYHGPADDLTQPVDKEAAAKFNRLLTRIALSIANAEQRPEWREDSFFRRFARK